jgi:hypothetical protein
VGIAAWGNEVQPLGCLGRPPQHRRLLDDFPIRLGDPQPPPAIARSLQGLKQRKGPFCEAREDCRPAASLDRFNRCVDQTSCRAARQRGLLLIFSGNTAGIWTACGAARAAAS